MLRCRFEPLIRHPMNFFVFCLNSPGLATAFRIDRHDFASIVVYLVDATNPYVELTPNASSTFRESHPKRHAHVFFTKIPILRDKSELTFEPISVQRFVIRWFCFNPFSVFPIFSFLWYCGCHWIEIIAKGFPWSPGHNHNI